MKKIFLLTILSFALFAGCKKDNDNLIDGEKPEERLTEALTRYKDILTGSQYGWKAYLYPDGGGGYSFYLSFNPENRVSMYADLDYGPAEVSKESSYSLKGQQIPLLSFDTYNYMHILADPDPSIFGGVPGWGVYSDFEFSFDKESGDTLKLNGKLLGSKLILVKATQEEKESYDNKGLFNSVSTAVNYVNENPNLYVLLGDGVKVQTSIDYSYKKLSLIWVAEDGDVATVSSAFVFTLTGILLEEPVEYNGKKITEFIWDPVKMIYYTTVDGTKIELTVSSTPILPLHLLIGASYTSITVPNATTYPGWGTDFISRRAAAVTGLSTWNIGAGPLMLQTMAFKFNSIAKSVSVLISAPDGVNAFSLTYNYSFTKTSNGVFKFTLGSMGGNESAIAGSLATILSQRIGADQFTLDYFTHPTTGATLGQFKSVEHPDFTFTGALQ